MARNPQVTLCYKVLLPLEVRSVPVNDAFPAVPSNTVLQGTQGVLEGRARAGER
jgi:hypothetical protein